MFLIKTKIDEASSSQIKCHLHNITLRKRNEGKRKTGGNEGRFNAVSPVRPYAYRKHSNNHQRTCHNHSVYHWQE